MPLTSKDLLGFAETVERLDLMVPVRCETLGQVSSLHDSNPKNDVTGINELGINSRLPIVAGIINQLPAFLAGVVELMEERNELRKRLDNIERQNSPEQILDSGRIFVGVDMAERPDAADAISYALEATRNSVSLFAAPETVSSRRIPHEMECYPALIDETPKASQIERPEHHAKTRGSGGPFYPPWETVKLSPSQANSAQTVNKLFGEAWVCAAELMASLPETQRETAIKELDNAIAENTNRFESMIAEIEDVPHATVPRSESMKPQTGTDEGDHCGRNGCSGTIELGDPDDGCCSCHINPPCSYCTGKRLICNECGHEVGEQENES